jgi:glycosyltransferase involved in cell wall biosynthesis
LKKRSVLTETFSTVKSVVILGPAYPFRGGGITTFNERLAREFQHKGYLTIIYGFSLQYPSFFFPGKTQYSADPPPEGLTILTKVNSINPVNWLSVGNELNKLQPDLIVVRFWLPFMAPSLGTILRVARRNNHTRVVAITDNVIPHEKRFGDFALTKYFLNSCDAFITMSEHVMNDIKQLAPGKPARQVLHPLYDNFGLAISKKSARENLGLPQDDKLLLFFGFIRRYKGLDILLEAVKILSATPAALPKFKLLIAGEFYGEEKFYQDKIDELGIRNLLILKTSYIPENEVKNYFCAADVVVQPYRTATQSGVTPLAYHFDKPMIVTNVGALAAYVPHEKAGLVAEPNPASLAEAVRRYFELGEQYFIPHLRTEKQQLSWSKLVDAIVGLGYGV